MDKRFAAVRGMHDVLPADMPLWHWLEACTRRVMGAYGYAEIRTPIVEKTALFARSIGAVTDIVEKEMYAFEDRSGEHLALRPENTAGCVRAGLQHGLLHNQIQRIWYSGPMFRHEKPQQGRYRQFYQIGAEVFGLDNPGVEAELILLAARLWRELGINHLVSLQLNTLGTLAERQVYRTQLINYLEQHRHALDADSQRRLTRNPLRVLDSKNPNTQQIVAAAPKLIDCLSTASREHFERVQYLLSENQLAFSINDQLVRGLDYYSHTVFEWLTDHLGAQSAVCGGGRYDDLVEQLGGRATPAAGWALGMERLLELLKLGTSTPPAQGIDLYIACLDAEAEAYCSRLAEQLRTAAPACSIVLHQGPGGLKQQLRRADRLGVRWTVIVGESELASQQLVLKPMRAQGEQRTLSALEIGALLSTGLP